MHLGASPGYMAAHLRCLAVYPGVGLAGSTPQRRTNLAASQF